MQELLLESLDILELPFKVLRIHLAEELATHYDIAIECEIAIDREYASIIGRDQKGHTACYPMTENVMRDGILIGSHVPSGIDATLADLAADYAKRLVDAMDYVGVLAIEFFLTDGQLIVNEIAPRVHNTGHWTIGAIFEPY